MLERGQRMRGHPGLHRQPDDRSLAGLTGHHSGVRLDSRLWSPCSQSICTLTALLRWSVRWLISTGVGFISIWLQASFANDLASLK